MYSFHIATTRGNIEKISKLCLDNDLHARDRGSMMYLFRDLSNSTIKPGFCKCITYCIYEGKPVGVAVAIIPNGWAEYLKFWRIKDGFKADIGVWVSQSHRRIGIGTRLIKMLRYKIKAKPEQLRWHKVGTNGHASEFYTEALNT